MNKKPELIVALDVDTLEDIREFIDTLGDSVNIYKIGSQAFTACGPAAVRFVMARGKQVFLDLKYHDIPNTVMSAVRSATGLVRAVERNAPVSKENASQLGGLLMYTVHTSGGAEMMCAAVEAARASAKEWDILKPLTLGVTVLTSQANATNILELVLERAALAKRSGLDGVVASCQEAAAIRREFGRDFIIVTPGIRPSGSDIGDQKRVATPQEAIKSGSNYLVVGRPIVSAPDPKRAAIAILNEMNH
jgi:orotidine-5'-phosphate decarboxylase